MLAPLRSLRRVTLTFGLLATLSHCSDSTPSPHDGIGGASGAAANPAGAPGTSGGASSAGSTSSGGRPSGGATGASGSAGSFAGSGGDTGGSSSGAGGSSAIAGAAGVGGASGTAGTSSAAGQGGTAGAGGAPNAYHPCPSDGSPCKIMPFGDSITDGYNPDTPGGYRIELFRLAHSSGKNITFVGSGSNGPDMVDGVPFPRQHEGHSGWTIAPTGSRSGISTLVATVMPTFKPHIVLLMIGTNDAIDNYEMAKAPERLGALIDSVYNQLPNVTIVVAQPIPSRGDASKGDDTALSARIKTYCDAIPAVVKQRADAGKHITVVDMNTPFVPKASLIEDQWHPNAAGYTLLAQKWFGALSSLL